jgi:hypothetical protein
MPGNDKSTRQGQQSGGRQGSKGQGTMKGKQTA